MFLLMNGASLSRQSSCRTKSPILALAPERLVALGLAPGVVVDHAVDDLPVPVVALGDFPAGEVLAVEERHEALGGGVVVGARRRSRRASKTASGSDGESSFCASVSSIHCMSTGWRRKIERGVGVEESVGPEQEADRGDRHHRPVLDARDVRLAEGVPDDQVGRGDVAVGLRPAGQAVAAGVLVGIVAGRITLARPDRASPRGSWSGSPPA